MDSALPWMTYDATDFITKRLVPKSAVFEYGSGSSTAYWVRLGMRVTSVEHDPSWYEQVGQRIGSTENLELRLVPPEPSPNPSALDPADPESFASADPPFVNHSFRTYVSSVDRWDDGSLDMVVVDGRARTACVRRSAPKVRLGGLLVLDNADRSYYTDRNGDVLTRFDRHTFRGLVPSLPEFSQTDVYIRRR
jgi:hypothetical protein